MLQSFLLQDVYVFSLYVIGIPMNINGSLVLIDERKEMKDTDEPPGPAGEVHLRR